MSDELLDNYRRAAAWTGEKVAAATDLAARTPCDEWDIRQLLNHMLETQRYFASVGKGEDASPPGPTPAELIGADPGADLAATQNDVIDGFSQEGVIDKTGPALGIAFSDLLLHGWDVAKATGQDATMPAGLAEASHAVLDGRLTERKGMFKPEVQVSPAASAQDRLLAYTGRTPS